ncbi:MAG: hypothetical protein QOG81_1545, partial [Gaiellaceae bacterium]|nr:hypothetical protein [Gaiellaceae bacterium]
VDRHAGKPTRVFDGETIYFCGAGCKAKFDAEPERYLRRSAVSESRTATP